MLVCLVAAPVGDTVSADGSTTSTVESIASRLRSCIGRAVSRGVEELLGDASHFLKTTYATLRQLQLWEARTSPCLCGCIIQLLQAESLDLKLVLLLLLETCGWRCLELETQCWHLRCYQSHSFYFAPPAHAALQKSSWARAWHTEFAVGGLVVSGPWQRSG